MYPFGQIFTPLEVGGAPVVDDFYAVDRQLGVVVDRVEAKGVHPTTFRRFLYEVFYHRSGDSSN
ncbi:MAG: hypothetical protein QXU79_04270 [Candidatus Micrarchaeaceae archaeon]